MSFMYQEKVERFLVEAVDVFDPESDHYKAKVENEIDPDEDYRLIWSFAFRLDAENQMKEEQARWGDLRKYRVRDNGEPTIIIREMY